MHEASLALSILGIAEEQCRKAGYQRIISVEVKVGSASGTLPSALQTAFDIIKTDSMAADAELCIMEIPLGGQCGSCGRRFETEHQFILECPNCGGTDFKLDSGRELDITVIEVE